MPGIGVDIVLISRIKPWVKDCVMLDTVFTDGEKTWALEKRLPEKQLASIFAAKEAFMKAVGTGWTERVGWKDIEVVAGEGRPCLRLHHGAKEVCGGWSVFLSMTCEREAAVALVIAADSEVP